MGRQIIKHPEGGYNVWSTISDDWLFPGPITLDQYIAFLKKEKCDGLEEYVRDIAKELNRGGKPYYQFTMNYAEAEEIRLSKYQDPGG